MPRPNTRHSQGRISSAMAPSYSTTSSAAADDFGALSLASGSSPLSSRHSTASPSPSPSMSSASTSSVPTKGKGRAGQSTTVPKRKERQTRLQEHLRTVKPGSNSNGSLSSTKPLQTPSRRSSTMMMSGASKTLPSRMKELVVPQEQESMEVGSSATSSPLDTAVTSSGRPKRKAAQKVNMHELELESDGDVDAFDLDDVSINGSERDGRQAEGEEDEQMEEFAPRITKSTRGGKGGSRGKKALPTPVKSKREREISSLSTVSAGIDVEGMDEDEVQNRLETEKNELMERLAQHGINPQSDVLDRALLSLSTSNEKLTVESFLRALSSLDATTSPTSGRIVLPPPGLTVQVPNSAKRVSFSTLDSPSTPSSSHSSLFPSPPTKSAALPSTTLPIAPSLPSFPSSGPISSSHGLPIPPPLSASAHGSSSSSSLFGNSMPGMGRIAITRRHTSIGVVPTVSSLDASSQGPSLLPAFEPVRKPALPPRAPSTGGKSSASLGSSVSKLQSWLDDDDSDEEDSKQKPTSGQVETKLTSKSKGKEAAADEAETEEMEIRVGGKTVKVLRKRQIEETEDDDETMKQIPSLQSSKGKGKERAVDCLCGSPVSTDTASSHGIASCATCEANFHLSCLEVTSRRQLPLDWTCSRCSISAEGTTLETPTKRARVDPHKTPPLSQEPTFVPSSYSPHPRSNFSACPDIALAPSPTSSPVRRFAAVPTSPVQTSAKVVIPSTPQFGQDSDPRSDYSPCSPLFHRKNRSRLVSGVFDSAPFGSDWTGETTGQTGGGEGGGFDDETIGRQAPFADSLAAEWTQHPSGGSHNWHDVTMTPSRGLGSASNHSVAWETPFSSSHSRQSSFLHPHTQPHHHRTPSQDFLSGSALDHLQHGRNTAPAQMFSQRLFGNSPSGSHQDHPSSPSRDASPLNPKRIAASANRNHYRNASSNYILPPHAFSSPHSASIFSHFPPTPDSTSASGSLRPAFNAQQFPVSPSRPAGAGIGSAAMKSTMSAPGLLRNSSGGGLGIGYQEGGVNENETMQGSSFDDLLI